MKLIAAAAALALVAGSVDVEAQKRGKQNSSGGDKTPGARAKAPKGAEEASRPIHLARFAVAHFDGLTGEDRTRLIEEARNGDETAQQELEAAVTAGLERVSKLLADENTRGALELGIALGLVASPLAQNAQRIVDTDNPFDVLDALEEQINSLLDFQINENEVTWKGAAAAEQIWSQGTYTHAIRSD